MIRRSLAVLVALALASATGCDGGDDDLNTADDTADSSEVARVASDRGPVAGVAWDYQIGGAYPPDDGVEVVVRDRQEAPAAGRYNVCYVNGFQSQSSDRDWWLAEHPDLVLTVDGEPVTDPDWPGEMILDPTTAAHREQLAAIVGAWIDECAADGFDAVEIDNLDTFTRFPDELAEDESVRYAAALVERGHDAGLDMAQKNTAELLDRLDETGFDFAVVEECAAYDECDGFVDAFDGRVLAVEYEADDLRYGCDTWPELSFVLRDHDVVARGEPGYVRATC